MKGIILSGSRIREKADVRPKNNPKMIHFKAREKGLDFIVDVDKTLPDGLYGEAVRAIQAAEDENGEPAGSPAAQEGSEEEEELLEFFPDEETDV